MIQWYFSMITFMRSHVNPYKIFISPTSLHYEGIAIRPTPKPWAWWGYWNQTIP
jgi:hypothetical protein